MTTDQVIELTKRIARMYSFVERDEMYMDIWIHVAKDADYELTFERFYEYITNPTHARKPPMPADILVKLKPKDGFQLQEEQMQKWEAEAKANPPDWKKARGLFERLGVIGDE